MICLVCQQQRELRGAACSECLGELQSTLAITPEQVKMRGGRATTALLVDPWGRPHQVRRSTIIGRLHDEDGMSILDATISRRHASLTLRDDAWFVADLGSSNGTCIEGVRITRESPVRDGDRLRVGDVTFFFLDGVIAPPDVDTSSLGGFTFRGPRGGTATSTPPSSITIELREPTGGGGGVAVIDGKPVHLTVPQFELISLLYDRASSHGAGFATVPELVSTLSLDSAEPTEDHVRQLVRRLRRLLARAGITDLIESRYGAGYRLALLRT